MNANKRREKTSKEPRKPGKEEQEDRKERQETTKQVLSGRQESRKKPHLDANER
jgi:hypothetical protein